MLRTLIIDDEAHIRDMLTRLLARHCKQVRAVGIDFRIIFISACDKGLAQAFRLSGFEFLLKPINPEGLKNAVQSIEETGRQNLTMQLKVLEAKV
ncbi:MAG: hypothetical protein M0P58_12165 [Bacteroidales bacterium]|nr:hypothetical protein [Bacteroidales bacterium]